MLIPEVSKMFRKTTSFLPLLGVLIFLYIVYRARVSNIIDALSNINLIYLFIFVPFFVILVTFVRGYKWKLIIDSWGKKKIPLVRSSKITLIGFFVGFITPGRIGDFVRSFYLKKDRKLNFTESFSTVFVDRFIDLIVVLVFGVISVLIFSKYFNTNIFYGLIIFSIIALIGLYIIQKKKTVKIFLRPFYNLIVPEKYKKKVSKSFNDFYDSIIRYRKKKKLLFRVLVLNILNWFVIFTYMYFIALICGLNVSFLYILIISPLVVLVEIIPISVSGIGTREAALVFLLSFVNISASAAVSYSLVYMVLAGWTFSLLGMLLWLKEPIKIKNL